MVSEELKRVILETLNLDDFELDDATTADRVPGWDSLSHARVLTAVEKAFGIRFRSLEILKLRNVGDLHALVEAKTSSGGDLTGSRPRPAVRGDGAEPARALVGSGCSEEGRPGPIM